MATNDNQSRTEMVKKRPEEWLEHAESDAAKVAIQEIVDNQVGVIMRVRNEHLINNVDLLSSKVMKSSLPKEIRTEMAGLGSRLRAVIHEVSLRIEGRKYKKCEQGVGELDLSANERQQAQRLIFADKEVNVSCQTLRCTVDIVCDVNRRIIRQFEDAESRGGSNTQPSLVLGNAIIVFELTNYVIEYLEHFSVEGIRDLVAIQQEVAKKVVDLRRKEATLKAKAQSEPANELRDNINKNIQARIASLDLVSQEWEKYISSIRSVEDRLTPEIKSKLRDLSLIRSNAENQLQLLELVAVTAVVKESIQAIQGTIANLEKMELISLTPQRVQQLLNLTGKTR